jgi:hypothetical protein
LIVRFIMELKPKSFYITTFYILKYSVENLFF